MIFLKHVSFGFLLAMTAAQSATLHGQAKPNPDVIQTFPLPEPKADDAAVSGRKLVLRGKIAIDATTTVNFYEQPKSETVYNSLVRVERKGVSIARYNVGEITKHQSLRLVHAAIIRSGETGMWVCEYEGGGNGAREGFAILRFSPGGFELHTLPLTDFGKVVVFKGKPEQVEIWSALPDDAGANADPKAYGTRSCRLGAKGYLCSPPKRKVGRFSPGDINDPGIEIRP